MTAATIPAIAYESDPLAAALTVMGPRTPVLEGSPVESVRVLHRDEAGRSGIWECTPGRFTSTRNGDSELMVFIAGRGTLTTNDGTVHALRPGVALVAPDGWSGVWHIEETVRKIYTIWSSPSSDEPPSGGTA